eukprot:5025227-Ditylum_brightwellii.AAC.1
MELGAIVMDYEQDPVSSWKAMQTLEQGLQHHHMASRSIRMTKQDGIKAKTDEESSEVFGQHFSRGKGYHHEHGKWQIPGSHRGDV